LDPRLNEPSAKKILQGLGIKPLKFFGQSFLQELSVLKAPFEFLELSPQKSILEIGAGVGNVTRRILKEGPRVIALEVDHRFIPVLNQLKEEFPGFDFQIKDALSLSWDALFNGEPYSIFGNIPYNITGPLLEKMLLREKKWERGVLLLQEEVSRRLLAPPGEKEYSSLTLFARFKARIKKGPRVSRKCFFPVPKVDSAFIFLERKLEPDFPVIDEGFLLGLIRGTFQERRKTLSNNLLRIFPSLSRFELEELQSQVGFSFKRRSETLSLEEFSKLANILTSRKQDAKL
jgi:16S rRNA (adenine1518-N6/adenine1519-N6)-dimethyltransferase